MGDLISIPNGYAYNFKNGELRLKIKEIANSIISLSRWTGNKNKCPIPFLYRPNVSGCQTTYRGGYVDLDACDFTSCQNVIGYGTPSTTGIIKQIANCIEISNGQCCAVGHI